jgi:hypothetical protein
MNHYSKEALKKVAVQLMYATKYHCLGTLTLLNWDTTSARFLDFLLREKIVTKDLFLLTLDAKLMNEGRACFEDHLGGTPVENVIPVGSLAYALENGEFSAEEISQIDFDDVENVAEFCQRFGCGSNLPKKLLACLLKDA